MTARCVQPSNNSTADRCGMSSTATLLLRFVAAEQQIKQDRFVCRCSLKFFWNSR